MLCIRVKDRLGRPANARVKGARVSRVETSFEKVDTR
jgi:hypothetical protein